MPKQLHIRTETKEIWVIRRRDASSDPLVTRESEGAVPAQVEVVTAQRAGNRLKPKKRLK